ncbi:MULTISPECIES: cytochrome d ubiquinol oxidase subunit II [Kosakonia]|jgi:cytochrome d ubiquinol oxidase subunit II|uniref:Cytochrome d ubiquinol oxidase subunit II n=1 Tax=Kosakonia cowanii JCM 10956 = DSM 18146 TaxID=1300165 RepID=A0A807LKF1_9ENTR|nr:MULTISPECIES: cytochrome d ubiquinol oxidase subunit II [Kosakonia]MBS5772442.1 cytochrome d ubiquinol oxidase subunit II [Enterobacter cloacae]MDT3412227.1 cytochrome d ubiquinol oxidase subunit II [Atlantibacter sp. SORGH_AS_0304]APZ06558.1 cytochrome d ubiquinol oxidase subunit II [Kosakonia cowanii JCM 10956 = DSM 18146]AST68783.1 cytochrome d ubiquinol oxidase subunit II [Kosakonia cowanii]AZI87623.1 cytochrome d ubiquinol oxidase subunit II [Kosakonia sp. CCTCC M2018092]
MGIDLPLIWFVIIVFATLMYIVMDGFDLGIGILFPVTRDGHDRDVMVNSVAPVWDGNETWLVLGGAGLFGAFPLAYAVITDALTIPLTLMLIGLIFRGVAFEFRFKATEAHRPFWDKAFLSGSLLATFSQGVVVGAFINGFKVTGRTFSGGALDWLTPFNLFCGLGLVIAYALLGASWLVMKSGEPLQGKMRAAAKKLLLALLVVMGVISLWTPLSHGAIADRWFSMPNLLFFSPVPLLVIALSIWLWRCLGNEEVHRRPFLLTLGLIFLGFSGLGISIWPNIIPPDISFWQAAAPPQSQGFMLVGALLIIPIILVYTFWSYYVFRGKIQHGEGYH